MRRRYLKVLSNHRSQEYKRLPVAVLFSQQQPVPLEDFILSPPPSVSSAMHLVPITSILLAAASLCESQAVSAYKDANCTCGNWAGSPEPADVPIDAQLPIRDYTRRFFVEPQLLHAPFAPIMASEPKVQVPKIWGNSELLSDLDV